MSISFAQLEQAARALAPDERAQLAQIMLESLRGEAPSQVEAAWELEIAARLAAHGRGELEVFSAESVFAEARQKCRGLSTSQRVLPA